MLTVLCQIARSLNENYILWAVGGSMLLNRHGLIEQPGDIDLLISLDDVAEADALMNRLGPRKLQEKSELYLTEHFSEHIVNGCEIDMMAGLAISHTAGIYRYTFDTESVSDYEVIDDVIIPRMALEDWYVIYQLIPGRETKVALIEEYLLTHGLQRQSLLIRALDAELPPEVSARIKDTFRL